MIERLTGHSSIDAGLLYYRRLTDELTLESEVRWWHPTANETDFAGDVVRFGVGVAHQRFGSGFRVSPVAELVGWYVVDGYKTAVGGPMLAPLDASGDTIVNLKLGVRMHLNDYPASVYVGYGVALTSEDWYDNVLRLEYRHGI